MGRWRQTEVLDCTMPWQQYTGTLQIHVQVRSEGSPQWPTWACQNSETHQSHLFPYSLPAGQRKTDNVLKTSNKEQHVNYTKVAELKLATHLAIHSPLSLADHLVPVCKSAFPDSAIASSVKIGATKCTALVTWVLGPTITEKLICDMRRCVSKWPAYCCGVLQD